MSEVAWVVLGVVCIASVPGWVVLVEVLASLVPLRSRPTTAETIRTVVVIPAHNEEGQLGATLASVGAQRGEGVRVLVVADNCEDGTAAVARASGAEVIERRDEARRGKGYALAAAMDALRAGPPEVVVFLDADCRLEAGALPVLIGVCRDRDQCVQGVYLIDRPEPATPRDELSAFAVLVKNLVRPLGLRRLGLPCLVTGSGFAVPWAAISRVELASGNIVEDMKLGIDLAVSGCPPTLEPRAVIRSRLPSEERAGTTQRTRWEHGHLATIAGQVPRLVLEGLRQGRPGLLGLAMELAVPPLAFLVGGLVVLAVSAGLMGVVRGEWVLVWLGLVPLGLVGLAVAVAWLAYGRRIVAMGTLLRIPLYVLWKLPIYRRVLGKRQSAWVRTARDGEGSHG